jgi:hypothetical protein
LNNAGMTTSLAENHPLVVRTWRVGSISMGVTLLLIGTALAVSLWQDFNAYEVLLWVAPIVFIMLGLELLLYLKFSKSEKAIVRYDWLSVFFVGVIGMASLGLAFLMSTGLYDELQRELKMTQRSAFIETKAVKVPAGIEQISVHALSPVMISEADTKELQLLGQIRYWSPDKLERQDNRIMKTEIVGSTMYVMIGSPDHRDGGFVSDRIEMQLTLSVPKGLKVDFADF